MPTYTPNLNLAKPLVNDPTDEDQWGGQLNGNMDILDSAVNSAANVLNVAKTADYTVLASDKNKVFNFDVTTGSRVLTLLSAATAGNGFVVGVKKVDASANTVTVSPNIQGSTIVLSAQWSTYYFVSDGTNWLVKDATIPLPLITSQYVATGFVVDSAYAEYKTSTILSTIIPFDDTIPTSTEGTQIISLSITPKSVTNRLRLRFECWGANGTTSDVIVAAFFLNGGTSAIAAGAGSSGLNANSQVYTSLQYEFVPGSTSTQTITVRVGATGAAIFLNGNNSGRKLGGSGAATLIIEEIKA